MTIRRTETLPIVRGPVAVRSEAQAILRPMNLEAFQPSVSTLVGRWQSLVPDIVRHCEQKLSEYGNIANIERLARRSDDSFRGFPFADSDIYKTLESIAWGQSSHPVEQEAKWLQNITALLESVQDGDGYIDSKIQGDATRERWDDLLDSHELYCLGHLMQAGIAAKRIMRDERLFTVARQAADCVADAFGPGKDDGICGHPEIETALIEMYRETGEQRYLDTAVKMIDLRGHGLLKTRAYFGFGSRYYVDQVPVRQADEAMGHAVRQLYLQAGVVDAYLENGDRSLLEASERVWNSAHGRKMYITGGMGSRHRDESFGDDFELPPDRSYSETCAAIADFQWSFRLLLATADERYADAMERAMYNAIPVGASSDGLKYFYSNPLQVRTNHPEGTDYDSFAHRASWFDCPCCPPNVARLYASLPAYAATMDSDDALVIHHYFAGDIAVPCIDGGEVNVRVETAYPWDGAIRVVVPAHADLRAVKLRIPGWCDEPEYTAEGADIARSGRLLVVSWRKEDESADRIISLNLPMPVVKISADTRIDAVRGCVALARGPIVYAIEQLDVPQGITIEELSIEPDAAFIVNDELTDFAGLRIPTIHGEFVVSRCESAQAEDPYRPYRSPDGSDQKERIDIKAIPYFAWGNRSADDCSRAMRMWIPLA